GGPPFGRYLRHRDIEVVEVDGGAALGDAGEHADGARALPGVGERDHPVAVLLVRRPALHHRRRPRVVADPGGERGEATRGQTRPGRAVAAGVDAGRLGLHRLVDLLRVGGDQVPARVADRVIAHRLQPGEGQVRRELVALGVVHAYRTVEERHAG